MPEKQLLFFLPLIFALSFITFCFYRNPSTFVSIFRYQNSTAVNNYARGNIYKFKEQSFEAGKEKICPEIPPGIKNGEFVMNLQKLEMTEIERKFPDLQSGGHGTPAECRARHRIALILPYRNRYEHLRQFLPNMHSFLRNQQLDYAIFVVEQLGNGTFNRGLLLNIGFVESRKLYAWECFALHDIDVLPENGLNMYSCPPEPFTVKHLAVGFDGHKYILYYDHYFSGALIFSDQAFTRANGYSNEYWGWGGEDDDLYQRVINVGMNISRPSAQIGRYKELAHKKHEKGNEPNPSCRYKLLAKAKLRQPFDGLNSLNYTLKSVQLKKLYTHIKVELNLSENELEAKRKNCQK